MSLRRIVLRVLRSFTEKPHGSNSIEQALSRVNLRTEIRFLIIEGVTRTELTERVRVFDGIVKEPEVVIGICLPSATMTDFPVRKLRMDFRLPAVFVKWAVAPESMYHWLSLGSTRVMVLNAVGKSTVGSNFWFSDCGDASCGDECVVMVGREPRMPYCGNWCCWGNWDHDMNCCWGHIWYPLVKNGEFHCIWGRELL